MLTRVSIRPLRACAPVSCNNAGCSVYVLIAPAKDAQATMLLSRLASPPHLRLPTEASCVCRCLGSRLSYLAQCPGRRPELVGSLELTEICNRRLPRPDSVRRRAQFVSVASRPPSLRHLPPWRLRIPDTNRHVVSGTCYTWCRGGLGVDSGSDHRDQWSCATISCKNTCLAPLSARARV